MNVKTPNYKIINLDLSIERLQEPFNINAGFIGVTAITGDFFIQLDNLDADPINLRMLPVIRTKFEKIYISNAPQSDGYIQFIIGKHCEFDAHLGTINPQHTNIKLPIQNIPSFIRPVPVTPTPPPPVIFPPAPPPPPDPAPPTQILASNTIQYHDSNRVHINTTVPIDIYITTPIQTPLSGTKRISITAVEGTDLNIGLDVFLLSNNVRTLMGDLSPPQGNPLPYTSTSNFLPREYSIGDQIIIVGNPLAAASPILVFDDFKIMFDVV